MATARHGPGAQEIHAGRAAGYRRTGSVTAVTRICNWDLQLGQNFRESPRVRASIAFSRPLDCGTAMVIALLSSAPLCLGAGTQLSARIRGDPPVDRPKSADVDRPALVDTAPRRESRRSRVIRTS